MELSQTIPGETGMPYCVIMKTTSGSPVCQLLRRKYKNVEASAKPGADGKPYLKVKVKGLLSGGELTYEIKVKGKSIRTHDPLSWIDRIEEFDAFMN